MLLGVLYFAISSGGATQKDTIIAGVFAIGWLIFGFGYLFLQKILFGTPILFSKDHKKKMIKQKGFTPFAFPQTNLAHR